LARELFDLEHAGRWLNVPDHARHAVFLTPTGRRPTTAEAER